MSYFERVRISLFSFLKILFLLDFLLFFLNGNVLNLRSAWGEPLSTISNLMFNDSMCLPWRRKWQHIPVFLPGQSHGQRSLVGCSPWDHRVGHDLATEPTRTCLPTHSVLFLYSWVIAIQLSSCRFCILYVNFFLSSYDYKWNFIIFSKEYRSYWFFKNYF